MEEPDGKDFMRGPFSFYLLSFTVHSVQHTRTCKDVFQGENVLHSELH